MSIMVKEIYEAFKCAGVDDELAAAAQTVPAAEDLAIKGDIAGLQGDIAELKGDIAELKGDIANVYRLLWFMVGSLLAALIGLKFFD